MNRELLEAVNKHQPELMKKTAHTLSLIEKLDASFLPEVLQDFSLVGEVTTEKLASKAQVAKDIAKTVGIGMAASVGAGLATSIATDLYDAASRGLTKARNFRRIMEANPDLKNYDQKRLRTSYTTLHRYGPDFTSDPLMGGSLLKAMAGLDGHEWTMVKDVINSRKGLLDAKSRQFSPQRVETFHHEKKKDHTSLPTNG